MQSLTSIIRDLDVILSMHYIYISKLEKAIEKGEPFEHKAPTECAFGKRFYSEIWPHVDQYPPEIAEVIRQIESKHREFHEKAYEVEKLRATKEKEELIKFVKRTSTELIRTVLQLKNIRTDLLG